MAATPTCDVLTAASLTAYLAPGGVYDSYTNRDGHQVSERRGAARLHRHLPDQRHLSRLLTASFRNGLVRPRGRDSGRYRPGSPLPDDATVPGPPACIFG